jgi:hypothetical protein
VRRVGPAARHRGGQVAVVLATIAALERPMLARMAEDRR